MESCLFDDNVCLWWELIKEKIKKRSIRYAKQRHFMRKKEEMKLKEKLEVELEKIEKKTNCDKTNYVQVHADSRV